MRYGERGRRVSRGVVLLRSDAVRHLRNMPSASSGRGRSIVVRCSGCGQRVRLAGGRKLLARPSCSRCGARVDPRMWRRFAAGARGLMRARSGGVADRIGHALTWASVSCVAAAAGLLWLLGDVWWPATILLFGPRWVLLLPLAVVAAWAALRDPPLLMVVAVGLVIGVGPLVGGRVPWRSLLPSGGGDALRVATFNAEGGGSVEPLGILLDEWDADVVLFQECRGRLREQIRELERLGFPLHVHTESSLCITSRHPITSVRRMERDAFEAAGGSGLVQTYTIDWGGRAIALTNLHLETQRAGLELFRAGRVTEAIPRLREKSALRAVELRAARRWVDSLDVPRIVAGDFNTPPESRLFREEWRDWTNTFDARGLGMGGTRLNGWILARIDHVLVDDQWRVTEAHVGRDVGSDHLPVVATVRLR